MNTVNIAAKDFPKSFQHSFEIYYCNMFNTVNFPEYIQHRNEIVSLNTFYMFRSRFIVLLNLTNALHASSSIGVRTGFPGTKAVKSIK